MSFLKRIGVYATDLRAFGPGEFARLPAKLVGRREVSLHFRDLGEVLIRINDSDLEMFREVFARGSYDISTTPQHQRNVAVYNDIIQRGRTPLIIDAGANIGTASLWFARQFPLARIFALEPDKDSARICRFNIAHSPRATLVEAAIGSRHGNVKTLQQEGNASASTVERSDVGDTSVLTVPDIVKMAGGDCELFVVKIDIEGFEEDLFSFETGWMASCQAIFIELHDWLLPDRGSSLTFQKAAFGLGYEVLSKGETIVLVRPSNQTIG